MSWFERLPESLPGDGITVPSLPKDDEKASNVIRVEFRKRPNPKTVEFAENLLREVKEGNIKGITLFAEEHTGAVHLAISNGNLKITDWLSAVIMAVGNRLQDFWRD